MRIHEHTPITIAELSQRRASGLERARLVAINRLDLPAYVNRPAPPLRDEDADRLGRQDAA